MHNYNHVTSSFIVAKCFLSIIAPFLIFFAVIAKQVANQRVKSHCQWRNICNSPSQWNWCVVTYNGFWKRCQLLLKLTLYKSAHVYENRFIATFSSLRFYSEILVTIRHGVGIVTNFKTTVISPDFLVCKFCGKAQVLHSYRRMVRSYEKTLPLYKFSIPGN